MTVIAAALTRRDGVVVASDSMITSGWKEMTEGTQKLKVIKDRGYVLGFAGYVRPGQVIQNHVSWPKFRPEETDDHLAWAICEVVPAMRAALDAHNALRTSDGRDNSGVEILMAWEDHICVIGSDFSVVEAPSGRTAIGSGEAEALGALGDEGPWTKAAVIESVRRSSLTASGVGGPIWVASTKTLEIEEAG